MSSESKAGRPTGYLWVCLSVGLWRLGGTHHSGVGYKWDGVCAECHLLVLLPSLTSVVLIGRDVTWSYWGHSSGKIKANRHTLGACLIVVSSASYRGINERFWSVMLPSNRRYGRKTIQNLTYRRQSQELTEASTSLNPQSSDFLSGSASLHAVQSTQWTTTKCQSLLGLALRDYLINLSLLKALIKDLLHFYHLPELRVNSSDNSPGSMSSQH